MPAQSGRDKAVAHTVMLSAGGDWTCTCPDFVMRRRAAGELCKHAQAVKEHYAGLEIVFLGRERWQELSAEAACSAGAGDDDIIPY